MSDFSKQPSCFGSHLWSASSSECAGGPDPGYTHPHNGSHTREKCNWFQACGVANQRNRERRQQMPTPQPQVIPSHNLIRNNNTNNGVQPPPRPVAPHPSIPARPAIQQPSHYAQPYTAQAVQPQQTSFTTMAPPYIAQNGPAQIPMQYQQPGAQIPAYLTTPEPINYNESGLKILCRILLRSVLKAVGHAIASHFDHVPIRPHKPPQQ